MLKKITAAITVVIFTMMACSCTSIRREPISVFNKKSNNNARIDSLIKKSGVWVKFDQRTNPYIEDGAVKGYVSGNDGLSILTTIPLTDIKSVWVHRVNFGKSVVGLVVLGVSVLGAGFLALLLGNPFCPFVYSFNGRDYVFDAEPFAGAVSAGMERTELSILKHLQEVKGQYKLMLDNEVDARDCFNHLQLLVVDHAPDAQVIPGASGKIYTISNPLPPLQAYDQKGNDLLPLVKEMDDAVWHKGLERSEETGIKQSLVFRFPKPAHASSVTLIFKGSATLMATETLTRYAAAQGDGILEWYDEVKQAGPALEKLREHVNGNELLWLDVRVETKSGRKTKQRIRALPPLVSRPLAYTLDISDVPGDVLNIKLTPPASYWMIDYIAVDYGQNEIAHKTTETSVTALSPLKTSGHYSRKTDSENVADLLAKEDNKYLEIPHMGDPVQLIFKAPPLSAGKQRTIILKTGGYYHMKLSAAGMKEQI